MKRTIGFARAGRASAALATAAGVVLALHVPGTAAAQEWRLQPEIRVGGEYDDNARLRADDENIFEIDGYIVEGSAGIAYETQRTLFQLTPRARTRQYGEEEIDVDSDDQFLDLDWRHDTLKGSFGLDANYARESIRTAERADIDDIDLDDPDDIPTDATGIVFSNQRRERLRVVPNWNYNITERTFVQADFAYTDTSYGDEAFAQLRDYTDMRFTAGLGRQLTQRTRGYFGASFRQFESDSGNEVDGIGAGIGIETDVSETTLVRAEVGAERTEHNLTGEEDTNVVGNISIIRRLETTRLLAQDRRNVSAGGSGRVTERDTFNFKADRRFTERVSGALGVRAYQTAGIGAQAATIEERDYSEFYAELVVALSRSFSLDAEYRHARIDRSGDEGSANSNSVILWLVWRPTAIVSSR